MVDWKKAPSLMTESRRSHRRQMRLLGRPVIEGVRATEVVEEQAGCGEMSYPITLGYVIVKEVGVLQTMKRDGDSWQVMGALVHYFDERHPGRALIADARK